MRVCGERMGSSSDLARRWPVRSRVMSGELVKRETAAMCYTENYFLRSRHAACVTALLLFGFQLCLPIARVSLFGVSDLDPNQ